MVSWAPDPARPLDGRVHVDGTDTEYAAARGVRPRSGTQRARVLDAYKQLGERGSTDFEMGERLGLFRWVAGTRREELIRDGWPIADSGERRATDTGASAIVWKFKRLRSDAITTSCSVDDCDRIGNEDGLCHMHYTRRWRTGKLTSYLERSDPERFFEKVDSPSDPDSCWLWIGSIDDGYGSFRVGDNVLKAHRWIYEWVRGPIPTGLTIDHLCRVRNCVNPWHMEPVTAVENTLRGNAWSGLNARKTHCKRGHEFTPENTRVETTGSRRCLTCKREEHRRSARKLASLSQPPLSSASEDDTEIAHGEDVGRGGYVREVEQLALPLPGRVLKTERWA